MRERLPSVMVLVFYPELTHSVLVDYVSRARTRVGLVKSLTKQVRDGDYVGYRLIEIQKEVIGNL